jgi:hypothetical protein
MAMLLRMTTLCRVPKEMIFVWHLLKDILAELRDLNTLTFRNQLPLRLRLNLFFHFRFQSLVMMVARLLLSS